MTTATQRKPICRTEPDHCPTCGGKLVRAADGMLECPRCRRVVCRDDGRRVF